MMKKLILIINILTGMLATNTIYSQEHRLPASLGRAEFIEVEKGVKLHVTDLGEGRPIVLIHGWPLNNEMYEYQYQYLAGKGFRVIGISLRGFGKSDRPYGKYDFDVFSDDIHQVLDKLNLKNVVLGGFSMGGAVVLHYVSKYNDGHVAKLALFAAAAPSWIQRPGFKYGLTYEAANDFIQLTKTNRPEVIDGFDKAFAGTEKGLTKGMSDWLKAINMNASPYATSQSITALRDLDLRTDLPKITMPVAIFHGVNDKLCDFGLAEELHKGLKNSYTVRFENSGHALFIEEMSKFNSELEKFAKQ